MRCLFVAPANTCDFLAAVLWDGLQELLGDNNVFDAVGCPWLHASSTPYSSPVIEAVSRQRHGRLLKDNDDDYDVIVINACINREYGWGWLKQWQERLRLGGKIAYVEGWDAAWQVHPPEIHVDAVFRKEISPIVNYPYQPHYLTFAAPTRWFDDAAKGDRPIDVFFSGDPNTCLPGYPVRWPALGKVFQTKRKHKSVIMTGNLLGLQYSQYLACLRDSKLSLCLPAADNADSFRTYESIARGAVPVFVGYPNYVRDPWFPPEAVISTSIGDLPEHIDEALSHDLAPRRLALVAHALKYHTTYARAKQMLEVLI